MSLTRITIAIVAFVFSFSASDSSAMCASKGLRFSNTQKLSDEITTIIERGSSISLLAGFDVSISAPPTVDGPEFCAETLKLRQLAHLRNERLPTIICEQDTACFEFDGFRLDNDRNVRDFPFTLKLLAQSLYLVEPIIHKAKLQFDRVRPSFADTLLDPAIEVPGHPSFPSGHSTQATLIAEILSVLDASRREAFLADAERIAQNREIAGLHYHSDSIAGANLARNFLVFLHQTSWFAELLGRAKNEWN
ncbi:MAG: phosphatase PAP2 family protein [Pseudomonadota bacterium]